MRNVALQQFLYVIEVEMKAPPRDLEELQVGRMELLRPALVREPSEHPMSFSRLATSCRISNDKAR